MPKQNKIVAKNLKKLKGKMTLRVFANIVGVRQSTLHNYLKGRDPKASFIKQVCIKMGCDPVWLLGIGQHERINNDITEALKVGLYQDFIKEVSFKGQQILRQTGVK